MHLTFVLNDGRIYVLSTLLTVLLVAGAALGYVSLLVALLRPRQVVVQNGGRIPGPAYFDSRDYPPPPPPPS